ncbi:unnamed protein product [Cylindrotheca closterium]|uniref:Uncharacterized protein n=1 Tax=Cylindrotheca closterium TaxID=2856 RepID=A0AAD2CQD5_9STRA|nr:unnamed protein product [Cylindrotheca closterium]
MQSPNNANANANPSAKLPLSAAPPYHSILVLTAVSVFSLLTMPTLKDIDQVATIESLTTPLLPTYISPFGIGVIRFIFATFTLGIMIARILGPGMEINPTPSTKSQLKPWKLVLKGWKSITTFTWWSFLLLGLSFLALASISFLDAYDKRVPQWLLRFALLSFEISAPTGFLVSTVVKYALWPQSLKNKGPQGTNMFRSFFGLVTHNANVIMISIELCLLGGTPVCLEHMAVSPTIGVAYVLFTWFMMYRWVPHEKGPKFVYFFLDTTLGKDATIALLALVVVLFGFYLLFAILCKYILNSNAGSQEERSLLGNDAIVPRLLLVFGLSKLVCRFRN